MRIYNIDEGSFEMPEEWSDKSVNVFSPSGESPGDFSFVITRDGLEAQQSLDSYVEGQLAALSNAMSRFELIGKYAMRVDGLPAISAEFTWDSEGKAMAQRQTYVKYGRDILVFTATTIEKFTREYEGLIDHILATFRTSR